MESVAPPEDALRAEVAAAHWYHSIELPGQITTPGEYDLSHALARVPLPHSLEGMRCLDVGTRDGFWAFEMERRGAGEVIAIDLDDPTRYDWPGDAPKLDAAGHDRHAASQAAFGIAHRALRSRVQRRDFSVYDLEPQSIGRFDFAFIGTLLLHLRDPVGALAAIRRVLDGQLLSNDVCSPAMTVLHPRRPAAELLMREIPFWSIPNVAGRLRIVEAAGFEILRSGRPYLMGYGAGWRRERPRLRLNELVLRLGAPHTWILAQPRQHSP
ncbi:MAG TPA: class I SAM-dependent methyltransferase [Solirubrobacteraceae bacterium]|nr:class I SAM-dependent methyltransferase [Solirubrobacteraceae bacterium]